MTVFIHPQIDIYYSAFYLYALEQKFGKSNIHYTAQPFGILPDRSFELSMFFIIDDGKKQTRYALDLFDMTTIVDQVYEWCDVYGKINIREEDLNIYPKLIVLVPSFGIRCWNKIEGVYHIVDDLIKMHFQVEPNILRTVKRGIKQMRRLPMEAYSGNVRGESEDNYIFMISTLWHNGEISGIGKEVNESRVRFIDACRTIPQVSFEGGLVVTKRSLYLANQFVGYTTEGCNQIEWLEKTRRSSLVFNTPAYWNCHGWKLGEYLALGKAIVSTPIYNALPSPLEHGKNIHFVENTVESMKEAVDYIISHPEYRHTLEKGASEYWEMYGTPAQSLNLLGIL